MNVYTVEDITLVYKLHLSSGHGMHAVHKMYTLRALPFVGANLKKGLTMNWFGLLLSEYMQRGIFSVTFQP